MIFAVLSTRGGRVGMAGAAGLTVVGAGATAGALGEKIMYRVLSPKTFDLPRRLSCPRASSFRR